jgi:hypothetical protein
MTSSEKPPDVEKTELTETKKRKKSVEKTELTETKKRKEIC